MACSSADAFRISPDGRLAAARVGAEVRVWEAETGRPLVRHVVPGDLTQLESSPRGSKLAVMDGSGRMTVFDATAPRRRVLTTGGPGKVRGSSLCFSDDETRLAIGLDRSPGGPQPVEVWEVETARRIGVFPGRPASHQAAFLPGSRSTLVIGGVDPRIWRLDPPGGPNALAGHASEAWAAAFSPDGRVLATGSDDTGEPLNIRMWDPVTGRPLAAWKGHTATVAALTFSPDGRVLASVSLDPGGPDRPNVRMWEVATRQYLASLKGHTDVVRAVAFSPDGKTLATAGDDRTARLWDAASGQPRAVLSGHAARMTGVAFSPDGRTLATSSNDATVRLWDLGTGTVPAGPPPPAAGPCRRVRRGRLDAGLSRQ